MASPGDKASVDRPGKFIGTPWTAQFSCEGCLAGRALLCPETQGRQKDHMTDPRTRFGANPEVTRRRLLSGAGLAAAGLAGVALTGCGDDDDDDTEATAAPSTATTQAAASPSTAAKADVPEEFVVANEAEPADLMPMFGGFGAALVTRAIYETMVRVRMTAQPDGTVKTEYLPILAEKWTHPDLTTFTFTLRPGVKFHNGEPWDAEAAKLAFDTMADSEAMAALKKSAFLARVVERTEIVDPMTVKVTTKYPVSEAEFFSSAMVLGYAAFPPKAFSEGGFEALAENPIGTGPYKFVSWARGQNVVLEQWDGYWGTLPNMKRLKFITREEASVRAQTVKTGEAHFAFNIGAEQASSLDNSVVGAGFQTNCLRLNTQKAPTDDVRVRRAINMAIDREGVNEAIFGGTATPVRFFAYQPVKLDLWPYDPAEAARLVQEAGAEGAEVELVFGEFRIPEEAQLAEIFQSQIEESGLKVKLTRLEKRQYDELNQVDIAQQPHLFMESTSSGNYGDSVGALTDKYGCGGSQRAFCDPAFDKRFEAMRSMDREELLPKLDEIAHELEGDDLALRAWTLGVNQVHGLATDVAADFPLNVYPYWQDVRFV